MTTPVDTEVPDVTAVRERLDANDRCDRCLAQAYVKTAHIHGDLLWCQHHFREANRDDALTNFVVADEREQLYS